jgi:hypothetical protein
MIAFVTLILGLISGVYPIEVTVSGPVAAVEFTLDGAAVSRIEGSPWIGHLNLGSSLLPHQIVARALDARGNEIAHVTQWINLPRPPAEVEIVLESDDKKVPKSAQLTWQSVNGVNPTSIGLSLDGEPLKVDPAGRAALPPRDLGSLHVLSAELWFPPGMTAHRDVAYGGQYGSEVSTELTALPVRVRPGAPFPSNPAELKGWFALGDQPLPVAAVEDGPAKVILVRVPAGPEVLDKLVPPSRRSMINLFQSRMRLGVDDRVRFLSLAGNPYRDSKVPAELFDMSRELTAQDGGLFWYLTRSSMLKEPRDQTRRITDAVAVAGLQAAADNNRRAVVLVLGRDNKDASRYDAATVRRYLAAIHVPLFVWSLYGTDTPAALAWAQGAETAEDISTVPKLEQAVARLKAELDDQRIVWLDGRHLPQAIALGPAAKGVEIVVGTPAR